MSATGSAEPIRLAWENDQTAMNSPLILGVVLAWLVVMPVLFRVLGPRRASLIAVFGGFLFLPRSDQTLVTPVLTVVVSKLMTAGLAPLLGVVLFDFRTLLRARPSRLDLPMAAFVLWPLASAAVNGSPGGFAWLHTVGWNFTVWAAPYIVGRLYFGSPEGAREVATALVVAGLAYVPVCLFEMVMGPDWYLLGLLYGVPPFETMVLRLGGWRPEGFLSNGLELAAWMALVSVVACWLWISRGGRRLGRIPPAVPALGLTLTSLACRGVYGYLLLGAGLLATALTQWLRTRLVLVVLLLAPLLYLGLRISGTWDGRDLVAMARKAGNASTVAARLDFEDRRLDYLEHHTRTALVGDGVHEWADGFWVVNIRRDGIIGLTLFLAALFVVPVSLFLLNHPGRTVRGTAVSPAWGLALFAVLHMADCLHNTSHLPPTTLIGGALTGLCLAERAARRVRRSPSGTSIPNRLPITSHAVWVALVLILWGLVELVGYWSESSSTNAPPGTPPAGAEIDLPPS